MFVAAPAYANDSTAPKGIAEKSAVVNGVRINYKIAGTGPTVVLLHGYTQTSRMWLPLIPLLADSHTVIAPDLRGIGDSERSQGGYDKKTMAQDIHALVQQLGRKQVQIVGHDIGLMVAYAYAAQYPQEVSKVILMEYSSFLVSATGKMSGCCAICGIFTSTARRRSPWWRGGNVSTSSTSGTTSLRTLQNPCQKLIVGSMPLRTPATAACVRASRCSETLSRTPRISLPFPPRSSTCLFLFCQARKLREPFSSIR